MRGGSKEIICLDKMKEERGKRKEANLGQFSSSEDIFISILQDHDSGVTAGEKRQRTASKDSSTRIIQTLQ